MHAAHTAARAGAVALLATFAVTGLLGGPVSAAPVSAAPAAGVQATVTATPPAVSSNWYWAEKAPAPGGNALPALPAPADPASGVPAGDLGVGLVADQAAPADKVAAVGFDLTTIPARSVFTRFTVTVPVDSGATQAQTAQPALSACENIDSFLDGTGPTDMSKAPPVSLPSCVKGVFDAKRGYVFDLTTMANDWSFGAPSAGISLRPTTTAPGTAPFSVALKGKNSITTAAEYTAPEVAAVPAATSPGAPVVAAPPAVSTGTSGGGVALPPAVPVDTLPAPQAAPAAPAPQVNPAPQAAPVAIQASAFVPGDPTPSAGWWLGLLGVLALLGLTAVVLGDPMAPVVVDARRRRFAGVVRARTQVAAPAGHRTSAPRIRPV